MAISLPQTIREDSTGEFPQEKGALLCDELERGMAGRHFEAFLWLLPPREVPQCRPYGRSNGAQECADALCARSRGSEKFRRYHRLVDDLSARRWQSSQLRGVIDWNGGSGILSLKDGRGSFIRPPRMVATRILHDTVIM